MKTNKQNSYYIIRKMLTEKDSLQDAFWRYPDFIDLKKILPANNK